MRQFDSPFDFVYRVGLANGPWKLPDWRYSPFDDRFADPEQQYRVQYAARRPFGAFVEKLQRYRPDVQAMSEIASVEGSQDPAPPTSLPERFYDEYCLAVAHLEISANQGLADFVTPEGVADASKAIAAAAAASRHRVAVADFPTIMARTPRAFTQYLGRWAYDHGFAGVAYPSRFAPVETCFALFEGRHKLFSMMTRFLGPNLSDLVRAARIHGIFLTRRMESR
jgi:hypothetical protein